MTAAVAVHPNTVAKDRAKHRILCLAVSRRGWITTSAAKAVTHVSMRSALRYIKEMEAEGKLTQEGFTSYKLTQLGRDTL